MHIGSDDERPTMMTASNGRAPWVPWLLSGAAGIGGALAEVAPSGSSVTDHLLAAAAAATVAWAGARASSWCLFPLVAVGVAFGSAPLGLACGVLGLLVATWANTGQRETPILGALAAGLGVQALLRLHVPGFNGADTLLAVAAVAPLLLSGLPIRHRRARQASAVIVLVGVALVAVGYLSVATARTAGERGTRQLQQAMRTARTGDSEAAAAELEDAGRSFASAHGALTSWWSLPARGLPIVGPNLEAMAVATDVASDVSDVGAGALEDTAAADLAVRHGRIPLAAFAGLETPLLRVEAALADAQGRLDAPASAWGLSPVRARLDELKDRLGEAQHDTDVALSAVRTLPDFFGASGTRRYLVLFVTPVEGRASGFPGNFAELTLTDGDIDMTRFGRIGDLERDDTPLGTLDVSMSPEFEARYGHLGATDTWRDITLTPDFPTVAELARQIYPQTGGTEIDGVVSVDPAALSALLRLTGPISVPGLGRRLTAGNAEEFLLRDQYVDLPERANRIDALESLGRATFDALLERDLPDPQAIARVLSPAFEAQHLRVVAFDGPVSRFFDETGLTGALLPVTGDALAVTTNNVIGNKVDLFLQRSIDYDVEWDPVTRSAHTVLSIHLVNGAPSSGLPDYVIGNALDDGGSVPLGTNRTYLSVFTPLGLESATLDGTPLQMESQLEAGRRVYSAYLELGPDGGEATVELTLSGPLTGGAAYHLDVAPQVLALPDQLSLRVREGDRVVLEVDHQQLSTRVAFDE